MNTIINSFIENATNEIVDRVVAKINTTLENKIHEAVKLHLQNNGTDNSAAVNVKDEVLNLIKEDSDISDAIVDAVSNSDQFVQESDFDSRVCEYVENMSFEVRVNG
jgi:hypothetical protein